MKLLFFIPMLGLFLMNCKTQLLKIDPTDLPRTYHYSVNSPQLTFDMPEDLLEISGLTLSPDGKNLCAVNDEMGIIFFINKENGTVEKRVQFGKEGDYEGIEAVGEKIYIVKSTGTVYDVQGFEKDTITLKKSKYLLKKENDSEGLGYDLVNNRLLLVCKGAPCLKTNSTEINCSSKRSVYSLNLDDDSFSPKPVFEITLSAIQEFLKENKTAEELLLFKNYLTPKDDIFKFSPSALAIHPFTQEIYILASKGKTFVVLRPDGSIAEVEKLDKKIHVQPEGIAFDEDGTMYISNEGKKRVQGKIHVFSPEKQ